MGKQSRLKEMREAVKKELKFQKQVGGDLLNQSMEWTQDISLVEAVKVLMAEKALNQALIFLLFSFYLTKMRWLIYVVGALVAYQTYELVALLLSLRASKKSKVR